LHCSIENGLRHFHLWCGAVIVSLTGMARSIFRAIHPSVPPRTAIQLTKA
jgi:hypothetical protein